MRSEPTERPPRVGRAEFLGRQKRARELAQRRGASGVVVVGRGGGTYDRHGDLWYLTGHYQTYPNLHDRPPLWSGRAHAVLVLPVDGPSVLICSAPEMDVDPPVDQVVTGEFAAAIRAAAPSMERAVMIGMDALPASLAAGFPLDQMEADDEFLEPLRRIKSPAEQHILRHVVGLACVGINALLAAARPGEREGDAVSAGLAAPLRAGALPYLICLAAGDRAGFYTGRPSPGYRPERRFVAGELVRLDYVIVYDGYYADFGRTFTIGEASGSQAAAIGRVRMGLAAAVAAAVPGASAGAIAAAGTAALGDASQSYPPHWGHGLGLGWEGPWLLPESDELIGKGYALAVETSITLDGVTASGEENVLVNAGGPEILSTVAWQA